MASVRYTFCLDPLEDTATIRWLESQPNLSAAVRQVLNAHVDGPTNADLGARLDEILNAIREARLTVPAPTEKVELDEPEAAVRGFEHLVEKFR